jgi:hypothetical protein
MKGSWIFMLLYSVSINGQLLLLVVQEFLPLRTNQKNQILVLETAIKPKLCSVELVFKGNNRFRAIIGVVGSSTSLTAGASFKATLVYLILTGPLAFKTTRVAINYMVVHPP